jgi:UTP--glucose-1-phosphate uridylyltransferase
MVRLMGQSDFHALVYDGKAYDCGDKLGYLRATAVFALADKEFGAQARATLEQLLKG